ncbi:MAG: tRNA (N(6)-L-threonylcarbamoyladenosine(37)-C(2))-methylthiotransferase MtaB [Proteobacteria bacterium]|nr:tRNA (N(6)-L-threonylcarbamoyladenosine(37)-C(2))-methylthiotransferase MtaB [Pseudomonadota bacterium]
MLKKVFVTFSGCKVNQFERGLLLEYFLKEGFYVTEKIDEADYIVFNTCAVTEKAESGCKQLIRRFNKLNPEAKIILTGCYAEKERDNLLRFKGVYKVYSNEEKLNIPAYLLNKGVKILNALDFEYKRTFKDRSRAFLKIQDGCDSYCSYCIVPLLRGKPVSMPLERVLKNLDNLLEENEVVLTGIHLSKWGKDFNKSLDDLMLSISMRNYPFRIRLSSLECNELSENLLKILRDMKNFCHHFHIPLQSGCNKILKLMKRQYDTSFFERKIEQIRKYFSNACIGVDIIVGFPEENQNDFMETFGFVNNLPIDYLHIFTYSPREGTESYNLPNRVEREITKERYNKLKDIDNAKRKALIKRFENKEVLCIPDKKINENYYRVLSREYLKLFIKDKIPQKEFRAKIINIETMEAMIV